MGKRDEIPDEVADAIVTRILQRLVDKDAGHGMKVLREVSTEAEMKQWTDAEERHAARQRAKGKPGW